MKPDIDAGTFSGSVTISVDVKEPMEEIILNNDGLSISSATVNGQACAWSIDNELERMTLAAAVGSGPAELAIDFAGNFNENLVGFYLSTFTEDAVDTRDGKGEGGVGVKRALATTQFEATHARKAFPCWDEPDRKAVFEITITCPSEFQAIANSAESSRSDNGDGTATVSFAPTIVMSTYLVAFVVGPMEFSDTVDVDGSAAASGSHSREGSTCAILRWNAGRSASDISPSTSGCRTPDDKVDLVAIPDFRVRGHGEPGLHHVPGSAAAHGSAQCDPARDAAGGRCHQP